MHSKSPPRNRLAKVLPKEWQKYLNDNGTPRRKYAAVCRVTLADGRVIEQLVIEEGWIVALDKKGLAGQLEQRIDFDPREISAIEVLQVI